MKLAVILSGAMLALAPAIALAQESSPTDPAATDGATAPAVSAKTHTAKKAKKPAKKTSAAAKKPAEPSSESAPPSDAGSK